MYIFVFTMNISGLIGTLYRFSKGSDENMVVVAERVGD